MESLGPHQPLAGPLSGACWRRGSVRLIATKPARSRPVPSRKKYGNAACPTPISFTALTISSRPSRFRPDKLNAWTSEMDADVHHAVERVAADDAVRAIVITCAGSGFCAGADTSRLSRLSAGETPGAIVGANGSKPGNFEQKFSYLLG